MLLATHTIIGTTLAQSLALSPAGAFAGGLILHYASDAFPHWNLSFRSTLMEDESDPEHKKLRSVTGTLIGIAEAAGELLAGVLVAWLLYGSSLSPAVFLAATGGSILPDILQFFYLLKKDSPVLRAFQKIHDWWHVPEEKEIKNVAAGLSLQVAIILAVIIIGRL